MRTSTAILLSATAALGMTAVASAQQRLPRECRQEVRQLCGSDRSQVGSCLREKASELSSECQSELRDMMQSRRGSDRQRTHGATAIAPDTAIMFGAHSCQQIDFYSVKGGGSENTSPIILFVHGGGWVMGDRAQAVHAKPAYYTSNGYAFASTGYRLVPEATVEQQAQDIAAAIAALRGQAETLGIDPDRIVLMGHSAGAHLAALVATDPQYAGDDMAAIQGVVLLDGAGYDVPVSLENAEPVVRRTYNKAFSDDPARQTALSPLTHVSAPDAPNWLILFVEQRERSKAQSTALTLALREAGAKAEALPIANTDHRRLNTQLGIAGDAATMLVDEFLRKVTAD